MREPKTLRCEVNEAGQPALPAIDVRADRVVIGSGADAQVRLPAQAARSAVVAIEGDRWTVLAPVNVDGAAKSEGATGELGDGASFESGGYTVRVAPAPDGAPPSPPQRTESLARELVRSMLGGSAAPSLTIERGPGAGAKRTLPPPEAIVVIGRGDEATWPIADEDLSRTHAELRRGWDGVTLRDLGSKNGTRVDGRRVKEPLLLSDGMRLELGNLVLRYEDPAERHLRGGTPPPRPIAPAPTPRGSSAAFYIAVAIAMLATVALVWVLTA